MSIAKKFAHKAEAVKGSVKKTAGRPGSRRLPGHGPMAFSEGGTGISQSLTTVSGVSLAVWPGLRVLYRPPGRLVSRA
jgi:hypothetical protein